MEHRKITLEAARVNAKYTQAEAADKLGISRATLQNYESGKYTPTWDTVQKIEQVYNWPASDIFFGNNLAISEEDTTPPTIKQ